MLDKNIAAFLREDARTVHVVFGVSSTTQGIIGAGVGLPSVKDFTANVQGGCCYTFVTTLALVAGDVVVVPCTINNASVLAAATVVRVDAEVQIEPDSNTRYKWVICKVDMTAYAAEMQTNTLIEQTVRDAYQRALKGSFRDKLLGNLAPDDRSRLEAVLTRKVAAPATDSTLVE